MRKNFFKKNVYLILIIVIVITVILSYKKKEGFSKTYSCPNGHSRQTPTTNFPLCWNGNIPNGQRPYLKVRFIGHLDEYGFNRRIFTVYDDSPSLKSVFDRNDTYKTYIARAIHEFITPSKKISEGNKNLPFRNLPNILNMPPNYIQNYKDIVWGFLATKDGIESSTFVPFAPGTTATNIRKSLDNGQITDIYIAYAAPSNYILKFVAIGITSLDTFQLFPPNSNYTSSFAVFAT